MLQSMYVSISIKHQFQQLLCVTKETEIQLNIHIHIHTRTLMVLMRLSASSLRLGFCS